jgi:hypothetical protein
MKKSSTVQTCKSEIFKEQKLTIGVDLGDRWSFYCVSDEAGKIRLTGHMDSLGVAQS